LGKSKPLNIETPPNPIDGHRAIRLRVGYGKKGKNSITYLGIRPAYHSISDPPVGISSTGELKLSLWMCYSPDLQMRLKIEEWNQLPIHTLPNLKGMNFFPKPLLENPNLVGIGTPPNGGFNFKSHKLGGKVNKVGENHVLGVYLKHPWLGTSSIQRQLPELMGTRGNFP